MGVFNIFVVMAIFNILNARIINDDKNIFKNLLSNSVFCMVFVFIAIGQGIIVEFGSDALKISRGGLHGYHWLIAVILGLGTWVVSFFAKLIPDSMCPQLGKKNNQTSDEGSVNGSQRGNSVKRQGSSLRGKLRGSHRKQQSQNNMTPIEKEYK